MAVALVMAAPAGADQLVFGCGQGFENLCRARPDGTGLQRLTTGGDASRSTDSFYRAPALSRDGRTLAYVSRTCSCAGRTTARSFKPRRSSAPC